MTCFTKTAAAVALAALSTLALAAEPIKIGVDGPFNGGSSSMGVSMRDGVRLATDEINKAGGVLGRQLLLVERDDEAKIVITTRPTPLQDKAFRLLALNPACTQ